MNRVCSVQTTVESGIAAGEKEACRVSRREEAPPSEKSGESIPACVQYTRDGAHERGSCHGTQLLYSRSELRSSGTCRRDSVSSMISEELLGEACKHGFCNLKRNGNERERTVELGRFYEQDNTCSKFIPLTDWGAVVSRRVRKTRIHHIDCTNTPAPFSVFRHSDISQ